MNKSVIDDLKVRVEIHNYLIQKASEVYEDIDDILHDELDDIDVDKACEILEAMQDFGVNQEPYANFIMHSEVLDKYIE